MTERETQSASKTFLSPRWRWRTLFSVLATPFLGFILWQSTDIALSILRWLPRSIALLTGLFLLSALLSLALSDWMRALPLSVGQIYRLVFLLTVIVSISRWLIFPPGFLSPLWGLAFGFSGAFAGVLIGTALQFGLWEDNYPPPAEIREEVHQKHIALIGVPKRTPFSKRLFDITLSLLGLGLAIPVWLLSIFLIWFENPGPLFFVKNSVGRGGVNFHQFKFRTMVRDAENNTGPVLASEADTRALRVGRFLRKTALDELPQLINILRGDMSFVGPRPQRTVLVHEYLHTMPEFAERHRVLPGLAGLAQVAGDYYITPRQKLRYDRIYADHASLGFDLKLIMLAFLLVFYLRWKPGWDGRIPRRWLH